LVAKAVPFRVLPFGQSPIQEHNQALNEGDLMANPSTGTAARPLAREAQGTGVLGLTRAQGWAEFAAMAEGW